MSPEMLEAFYLLAVGMVAVFGILGLVVLTGQLLIRLLNRMAPSPISDKPTSTGSPPQLSDSTEADIHPATLAVLVATVEEVTKGTGNIKKIKKI